MLGTLTILAEQLNLRGTAGVQDGNVLTTLPRGATADVLHATGTGWYGVRATVDGVPLDGFVSANPAHVRFVAVTPRETTRFVIRVKTGLNVRTAPALDAEVIAALEPDDECDVLEVIGRWYRIRWNAASAYLSAARKYSERVFTEVVDDGAATALPAGSVEWRPKRIGQLVPPARDVRQRLDADVLGPDPAPWTPLSTRDALIDALNRGEVRTPDAFAQAAALVRTLDPMDHGDLFELLTLWTPYFSQRDNDARFGNARVETTTGKMCNLTSMAMALTRQGLRIPGDAAEAQPEDRLETLREARGLGPRTQQSGWGAAAQAVGATIAHVSRPVHGRCDLGWWEATPRSALRDGASLVASISGHIVAVVGVCADGVLVHDPYGWSVLEAGEARSWNGRNRFDDAAGPRDDHRGRWVLYPADHLKRHVWRWVVTVRAA